MRREEEVTGRCNAQLTDVGNSRDASNYVAKSCRGGGSLAGRACVGPSNGRTLGRLAAARVGVPR